MVFQPSRKSTDWKVRMSTLWSPMKAYSPWNWMYIDEVPVSGVKCTFIDMRVEERIEGIGQT